MKLSELKQVVREAHKYHLKKLPGKGVWHTSYMFDCIEAHFYISNLELIYSKVPLKDMLNMKYTDFWNKYKEKYGVSDDMGTKELTIYLKEEK